MTDNIVLIAIVFSLGVILVVIIAHLKGKKRFNNILKGLGFKAPWLALSSRLKMTFQGEPFILDFHPLLFGKYTEDASEKEEYIKIRLPLSTKIGFTIKRREDTPLFSLQNEVKTHSPDFDKKFLLSSESEREVALLFQEETIKEAVKEAFNEWVREIELDGNYLSVIISTYAGGNPSTLKDLPAQLLKIKGLLQESQIYKPYKTKSYTHLSLYVLYLIPFALSVAEIFFSILLPLRMKKEFEVLIIKELLLTSLIIFGPILFLYLILSLRLVKRYPASDKKFYPCLILSIIWFLCSIPFGQSINGYFDKSSPKIEEYTVVYKSARRNSYRVLLGKNTEKIQREDSYKRFFFSLDDLGRERLSVKQEEYVKIRPYQSHVRVFVRKGALGMKWQDGYIFIKY